MKPKSTPSILSGVRVRQETPFGNMHVVITADVRTSQPYEIFAQLGKAGEIAASDLEAMCRLASVILRMGGDLSVIIDQLQGIGTSVFVSDDDEPRSLANSLAQALQAYQHAVAEAGSLGALLTRACESEEG